jgi:hypothetical protein
LFSGGRKGGLGKDPKQDGAIIIFGNKKAPTARVGIADDAILPFNPPVGMRNYLDKIADVRWLKGKTCIQCF